MPSMMRVQSATTASAQNSPPRTQRTKQPERSGGEPAAAAAPSRQRSNDQDTFQQVFGPRANEPGPIQARASGASASSAATPARADGPGAALPDGVRSHMETAFGTSFSDVRVHEGQQSSSLGASAYTQGSSIHFAPGQYSPHTTSGLSLLGHELTHVVQQRSEVVPSPQGKGGLSSLVNSDPSLEREADTLGARAAHGEQVQVRGAISRYQGAVQTKLAGSVIQCKAVKTVLPKFALHQGVVATNMDKSVQFTEDANSGRTIMEFNTDKYTHINDDAIDQYVAMAADREPKNEEYIDLAETGAQGATKLDSKHKREIPYFYAIAGNTGITLAANAPNQHLVSASGEVARILTGNNKQQIFESDPRHVGAHIEGLPNAHRHILKMAPGKMTKEELEEVVEAVQNIDPIVERDKQITAKNKAAKKSKQLQCN